MLPPEILNKARRAERGKEQEDRGPHTLEQPYKVSWCFDFHFQINEYTTVKLCFCLFQSKCSGSVLIKLRHCVSNTPNSSLIASVRTPAPARRPSQSFDADSCVAAIPTLLLLLLHPCLHDRQVGRVRFGITVSRLYVDCMTKALRRSKINGNGKVTSEGSKCEWWKFESKFQIVP